jgi:hypothetical protein
LTDPSTVLSCKTAMAEFQGHLTLQTTTRLLTKPVEYDNLEFCTSGTSSLQKNMPS